MLETTLGYTGGAGVSARWAVLDADEAFFRLTKRLDRLLHGVRLAGDRLPGEDDRRLYTETLAAHPDALLARMRPGDVAVLHDPQTAGLAPMLRDSGVRVIWRSHIGVDRQTPDVAATWTSSPRRSPRRT